APTPFPYTTLFRSVGVEIAFCERSGFATRLRQNGVSQRLQPRLAGNLGTGAALGLVWRVQVFQTLLGVGSVNLRPQLGRQLALGVNGLKYGAAPRFQLPRVDQPHFKVAQHRVIQAAGDFLTVAGDEGHGGAFIQQLYSGADLRRPDAEFSGKHADDAGWVGGKIRCRFWRYRLSHGCSG